MMFGCYYCDACGRGAMMDGCGCVSSAATAATSATATPASNANQITTRCGCYCDNRFINSTEMNVARHELGHMGRNIFYMRRYL